MSDKKQRLVASILEFLQASMDDGSIKQDDKEGIEVAMQCIAEAFSIDTSDAKQTAALSIKPANLQQIFDVYLKTQAKQGSKTMPSAPTSAGPSSAGEEKLASAEDAASAEKLKTQGNSLMASKKYSEAIEKYTEAIELNPKNPVYYSNRAAAHSQAGDHESAIEDAEKARTIDPNFAKAYSRAGHAYFSLGRYSEAAKAYEKAVELDPGNASLKSSLSTARSRASESEDGQTSRDVGASSPPPAGGANPFAGLAGLAGLGGGAGGAGGMPDIASLLQNPQLMQMAQQMMGNGGMERMMQNPMMRQMAERFQSGGGMPSMSEMASNPELRRLAEQFGGSGLGGNESGNGSGNPDMYS